MGSAWWHSGFINSQDLQHTCGGRLLTQLRNCDDIYLPQKNNLNLFWKSGCKFPADWRNTFFYQAKNLKFISTKKSTCLICPGHEVKTRHNGIQAFLPNNLISQEKDKLFFLFPSLKSAHTSSNPDTHTHTLLVQLYFQHDKRKCSLLHNVTLGFSASFFDLCRIEFDGFRKLFQHLVMSLSVSPLSELLCKSWEHALLSFLQSGRRGLQTPSHFTRLAFDSRRSYTDLRIKAFRGGVVTLPPFAPTRHINSSNYTLYGRWSTSGSEGGNAHFLPLQEYNRGDRRKTGRTNKHEQYAWG